MRVRPAKGKLARVVPDSLRSWARMPRGVHRETHGAWRCHEGLGLGVQLKGQSHIARIIKRDCGAGKGLSCLLGSKSQYSPRAINSHE